MLDATLVLYNQAGTILQTLDTTSLSESLSLSLSAGLYSVAVLSHGGASDATYTQRDFFDMGSYFITGSIRQPLAGDADLDGDVDFSDFLVLQANFGLAAANFKQGDFNFDGTTNFNDFLALQSNFGLTAAAGDVAITSEQVAAMTAFGLTAAVPEPSSLALIGMGLFALRRRRN
ncbi:MAG: PEP-CTERM sorting domain-containing protein [Tepidisphaeraceae bacterium]